MSIIVYCVIEAPRCELRVRGPVTGGAGDRPAVSSSWLKPTAVSGFLSTRTRGRSHGPLIDVGGLFCWRSHLAGVHIWFVTSRAGGPVLIKPIGRNPLGGHVDADSARDSSLARIPPFRSKSSWISLITIAITSRSSYVKMKVSSVDCRRLRKIIRKESGSCLIVDCRPYLSFTNSNIRGSVNVNLNSVVVRRSRGGPVPLHFVIPDESSLLRLREGSISAIVALDDRTSHWQKLKKDSVAQIVINTLAHLASGTNIFFLKGESFVTYYTVIQRVRNK